MATYLFLRLEFPSGIRLGPSRTAILEGIDRFGSIAASARAVGLTYRAVWATVKELNAIFPSPLVTVRAGGRSSGASLTPLGKELVARFRAMERDADRVLGAHIEGFERLLAEDPQAPALVPRWAQVRLGDDAAEPDPGAETAEPPVRE